MAEQVAERTAEATQTEIDNDMGNDVIAEAEAVVQSAEESFQSHSASTNGAASAADMAATTPMEETPLIPALSAEEIAKREMNRREFLFYAFGGATALIGLETLYSMFFFMYPRFKAGEFGGKFFMPATDFGDVTKAPKGNPDGKFWMVTTQEGTPKAIYMVCTHLGCLYKWIESNHRFECPCHGSKFSHDGFYIEGPAPRCLDFFEVEEQNGQIVVNTGAKKNGIPSGESPAKGAPIGTV